ncbi:MAG: formylglycine-generating enzyme family protein [Asticcacaulis sp.]
MSRSGMIHIPGGAFTMGSDHHYPEEAPSRRVKVDPFWIDETPVTNAQFARFVAETGYKTFAEIPPDPADYPGLRPEDALAGSLVFERTSGPVDTRVVQWWDFRTGARWNAPLGPGSSIEGIEDHPVVHVGWPDVQAYAQWAGKVLPTEAEWEFAAWGGREGSEFSWGDELAPQGQMLANYWQGTFPYSNDLLDGWERTSPVRTYPANGYGLYDMIGNVWEWTLDWYSQPKLEKKAKGSCCTPANPRGGTKAESIDPHQPGKPFPRKVIKGGSHLCAESYCRRYRPPARHPQSVDSTTSHVGFRCIIRG